LGYHYPNLIPQIFSNLLIMILTLHLIFGGLPEGEPFQQEPMELLVLQEFG
jgi:hypothetical protein